MRQRLLLGYLGLTLVVLVAFGVPFGLLWAGKVQSDELNALTSTAMSAARGVAEPLSAAFAGTSPPQVAPGAVPTLPAVDRTQIVANLTEFVGEERTLTALVDLAGKPFVALGELASLAGVALNDAQLKRLASGATIEESTTVGAHALLLAAVPVRPVVGGSTNTPVIGVVIVAEPTAVVDHRIRTIAFGLLALGLGTIALAGFAGWALVRSLIRPLQRIELAVADLGRGNLESRAPVESGPPELVHLALTVNTMATRLSELISAQRTFVADASHQLRTPLTGLRLRLENLSSGAPVAPEELDGILAEIDRLARLVTGLLALARAEAKPPMPEVVDVASLVAQRAGAWRSVAEDQGVALELAPSGPVPAWVVPDDLDQVLDNLIDNALKVTPAGGHLALRVEDHPTTVVVHVTDDGPGMAEADRLHAFDRFWSGREEGNAGSGLGLAIVAQLVHNSGGEIELHDAPGHGLDAVVTLRHE